MRRKQGKRSKGWRVKWRRKRYKWGGRSERKKWRRDEKERKKRGLEKKKGILKRGKKKTQEIYKYIYIDRDWIGQIDWLNLLNDRLAVLECCLGAVHIWKKKYAKRRNESNFFCLLFCLCVSLSSLFTLSLNYFLDVCCSLVASLWRVHIVVANCRCSHQRPHCTLFYTPWARKCPFFALSAHRCLVCLANYPFLCLSVSDHPHYLEMNKT